MATDNSEGETNFLFWGNHATEMAGTLAMLQQNCSMVDVTLRAGGETIEVHRMVLCASSPYLQQILSTTNDPNPCISIPDVEMKELKAIIEFIYRGEISFLINQLPSLLSVAELLGIHGLNEISSQIPHMEECESEVVLENDAVHEVEATTTITMPLWESDLGTEEEDTSVAVAEEIVQEKHSQEDTNEMIASPQKKKKMKIRRSDQSHRGEKKYCDATLEAALLDLKAGRSLCDTSIAFNIPRTTLYMRARACGVLSPIQKLGYTKEQLQDAINAVKEGSSLQHASNLYNVPKTVLWRRVQAFRDEIPYKSHQSYTSADKQAAVQALERGEQLQAVANQFPIPKTTLFREKVRLVEKGILPSDCIKRRKGDADFTRSARVEQAVLACKEGKMSQSAAAAHFQIPKTTIWRRLQLSQPSSSKSTKRSRRQEVKNTEIDMTEEQVDEEQETYEVDGSNLKFVTTEDGEFAASLIILSTVEGEQLQTENQLIVGNESATESMAEDESLNDGEEEDSEDIKTSM